MPTSLENETVLDRRPRLKEACRQLQGMAEELGAEAKLPTLVELRGQLGISMQTLSDAVRELEKRNVLNSVHGVGIYVTGQKMRVATGNVGFVVPYNVRPEQNIAYWSSILVGMRQAARERSYHLLLIENDTPFNQWEKVDGVVLCDTHDPRDFSYPSIPVPPPGFPCVSMLNEIKGTACVTSDDAGGTYQLTRHLLQWGHRRIAYLATVHAGLSLLKERKEGYLRALAEANIEPDPRWIRELRKHEKWDGYPSWYPIAGEYYMRRWLEEDWAGLGCTAVMVQNDETAYGVIKVFEEAAGMEVPRDVSVVGFDGLPTPPGAPQLTTVQVPLQEIGKRAMMSLLDWLKDPARIPQSIHLPVNFVRGQTTAPPSAILSQQAQLTASS